jgi:hypothetical protein
MVVVVLAERLLVVIVFAPDVFETDPEMAVLHPESL